MSGWLLLAAVALSLRGRHRLLMSTHWLRVGLVTTYRALSLWMLSKSLSGIAEGNG